MKKKKIYIIILCGVIVLFTSLYLVEINAMKKVDEKAVVSDEISAVLEIPGATYQSNVPRNSSVYDFMEKVMNDSQNKFSFTTKNYPGLGYFVDEINKEKGGGGKYWIYYINGKEASVGILKYIIKNGDIISWKLK